MENPGSTGRLNVLREFLVATGLIQRVAIVEVMFSTPEGREVIVAKNGAGLFGLSGPYHGGCSTSEGSGKQIRIRPSRMGLVTEPSGAFVSLECENPACAFRLAVSPAEFVKKLTELST